MKESASIALGYLKANYKKHFDIKSENISNMEMVCINDELLFSCSILGNPPSKQ